MEGKYVTKLQGLGLSVHGL